MNAPVRGAALGAGSATAAALARPRGTGLLAVLDRFFAPERPAWGVSQVTPFL